MPAAGVRGVTAGIVAVVTTTEKVLATLPPIETGLGVSGVLIGWRCVYTTGTATTVLTWHIRLGSAITGTIIGPDQAVDMIGSAGDTAEYAGCVIDTAPGGGPVVYSLCVKQTTANANGATVYVALWAAPLQ